MTAEISYVNKNKIYNGEYRNGKYFKKSTFKY
jgi:hypothetical protein